VRSTEPTLGTTSGGGRPGPESLPGRLLPCYGELVDDSSPIDARRTLWIVGLLIATIGVFLVLWLPNSKPWWKMEDFGCPDGYFRVDGGQALRVDGGCGGLSPFGVVLRSEERRVGK